MQQPDLNPLTCFAGVLYYGDQAGNDVKASDYIEELRTQAQLDEWLGKQGEKELKILNVCTMSASPCVHMFPAVLALARNMEGSASFARLVADADQSSGQLARDHNVTQVLSFTVLPCVGNDSVRVLTATGHDPGMAYVLGMIVIQLEDSTDNQQSQDL